jgi:hypothetical protein
MSSLLAPANDSLPGSARPLVPWQFEQLAAQLRTVRGSGAAVCADAMEVAPIMAIKRKVSFFMLFSISIEDRFVWVGLRS